MPQIQELKAFSSKKGKKLGFDLSTLWTYFGQKLDREMNIPRISA